MTELGSLTPALRARSFTPAGADDDCHFSRCTNFGLLMAPALPYVTALAVIHRPLTIRDAAPADL